MPLMNIDQARQAYVIKQGQGKGYATVENLLFYENNRNLVYGNAQAMVVQMIQSRKDLSVGSKHARMNEDRR